MTLFKGMLINRKSSRPMALPRSETVSGDDLSVVGVEIVAGANKRRQFRSCPFPLLSRSLFVLSSITTSCFLLRTGTEAYSPVRKRLFIPLWFEKKQHIKDVFCKSRKSRRSLETFACTFPYCQTCPIPHFTRGFTVVQYQNFGSP